MATPVEILQQLKILTLYYGNEPSEGKAQLYIDALQDLPAPQLSQAIQRHIQDSPFFPRISELRQQAAQIPNPAARPLSEVETYWRAMEAFNAYLRGELSGNDLQRRYGRMLRLALARP